MQNVSRAYKESMRGRIRNRGYIRATIGIFNQEAQKALAVNDTESPLLYLSKEETAFAGVVPERIYATAEQDFSKLDGTRYFAPEEDSEYEIYNNGMISEDILGDIYIDFGGESFDIKGLTIDFGEFYPTEFVIETNAVTRQYSEIDRGLWTTEDAWDNVSFFRIIPLSMANGNGRLRIYRFSCGLTNTFYNDKVQSFSSKEYVSTIAETIPSNDMTLTVFNYNMYYSPDNPESALAYMELGQEVRVAFGYDVNGNGDIEWLPEKKSYLKTWKANESTATFTSVDIFDMIGNDTYYVRGQYNASGTPLYDIAVDVLEDLGVVDYFIDTSLKNIMIVNPMPVVKHSAALQIIANAGRCVLKEGRSGQIQIVASYMPDMWASANNESEWSHVENILKNDVKDGYANASNDFSVVDGTLLFIPENPEEYRNTGYISESVWIENKDAEVVQRLGFRLGSKPIKFPLGGYWGGEMPEITIELEASYTAFGLSINFRNTAPQIFHITAYHGDTVVDFVRVENPDLIYHTDETFLEFDRMVITFDKGYPNSRVFVDNIMIGDNTDYDLMRDRDLITAPVATRQRKVQRISTAYTTYRQTTVKVTIASEKIEVSENNYEYVVTFKKPATGLSVALSVVSSAVKATIIESGTYYAKIRFTGITAAVNITYTISGYLYETESYNYNADYRRDGEAINWNNPLIGTAEHAQILEEWLAEYYLGDVEYDIDWKGDPAVDANDLFHLETKVGTSFIRSYENSLSFNGRWNGKMRARKVQRKGGGVGIKRLIYISATQPTKKQYEKGDALNLDGITVTAHYSNGETKDVTLLSTFNPVDGSVLQEYGDITITAKYTEDSVTKSGTTSVNVKSPALVSITVTAPTKTSYEIGETLDLSGITVIATYADESTKEVTEKSSFDPPTGTELAESGIVIITATYTESDITKTGTISVTVKPEIEIVSWADGTVEQLAAMLEAHYAGKINIHDYWSVGDERLVRFKSIQSYNNIESHAEQNQTMVLMNEGGMELENPINGNSECAFVVGQKNLFANRTSVEPGVINLQLRNSNGWSGSDRRSWLNSYYPTLFSDGINDLFKNFINESSRTVDKCAIPSRFNVFSIDSSSEKYQWEYYKTSENRIKKQGDNGTAVAWWLSTSASENDYSFYYVLGKGTEDLYRADFKLGISPFVVI